VHASISSIAARWTQGGGALLGQRCKGLALRIVGVSANKEGNRHLPRSHVCSSLAARASPRSWQVQKLSMRRTGLG
jgi:hypothetical protein